MSVNKILKKRRQQSAQQEVSNYNSEQMPVTGQAPQTGLKSKNDAKQEEEYQKYAEYSQYNPSSYQFSNSHLPSNASLNNRFRLPLSLMIPPVAYEMDPVERSIDKIPRCGSCRAYMNYYNQTIKKGYKCFLCGRDNALPQGYVLDPESVEVMHPSYHVLGGENVYQRSPPQNAMIFIVDLNVASYQCKMLYYFVAVMKDVLSRQQFDEHQIYFFTYDDTVHEYDFSGAEVKCTIFDSTIKKNDRNPPDNYLAQIRPKLFELLDTLQDIAEHNKKQGSNFFQAFSYVYQCVKQTGGKMFIFQTNEAISGEPFTNEYLKKDKGSNQNQPKPKSFLESKNRTLFTVFVQELLSDSISCSFFFFQRSYRNIRVFSDMCKLTNSELFSYKKDTNEDLMKFYYDFSYLLGTTYYSDVKIELILSPGWYFTAVYGNLYRIKEYICFHFCHLEPSKRICVCFMPQEVNQLPYCCMQVITNYIYNRQHFVTINTIVLPLTNSLEKLYSNHDYLLAAVSLHKTFLSSLRLEELSQIKNKIVKNMAGIWRAANQFYKKQVTPEIMNLMLSVLGLLKSTHCQLDSINDSMILDTVVCQRNLLQSSGVNEIQNFFSPYLFNLSTMDKSMCQQGQDFIYPEICELKFATVKQGIFLMDNGVSICLYVSKSYDPANMKDLFGKQKMSKNDKFTEQNIREDTVYGQQVLNLIRVCRQQKGYGWAPLTIIRCGEGSVNEKQFYMNFYAQKYDEFRTFKMTLNQFTAFLNQQY